jgi:hypothetical protein
VLHREGEGPAEIVYILVSLRRFNSQAKIHDDIGRFSLYYLLRLTEKRTREAEFNSLCKKGKEDSGEICLIESVGLLRRK